MDNRKVKVEVKKLKLADLHPTKKNPRKITPEDLDRLKGKLRDFPSMMDVREIVVDENLRILGGHQRVKALLADGETEATVKIVTGWTDDEKDKFIIRDNVSDGEWDEDIIDSDWDKDVLRDEGVPITDDEEEIEKEIEEPETPEVEDGPTICQPGDIWQLGEHRLLCGDSTKPEDVERLMAGETADLWLTDPPYNVDYEGGTGLKIQNDKMEDSAFRTFLNEAFFAAKNVLKDGGAFYIWHADSEGYNFRGACQDNDLKVRECLVWNKSSLVLGRQDYQWKHEPCQPAGTMVRTTNGIVPIENLKDGDMVIAYDTNTNSLKNRGAEIRTANRQYDGILYGVEAWNENTNQSYKTWATDNHEFSVKFNAGTSETWSTYLMRNEKGWWRVGITRTYDARGFGLKHRYDQEHANAAWIIQTYKSRAEAQIGEQVLACTYGIPYTHWNISRGQNDKYNHRNNSQIERLYDKMNLTEMESNAERMLENFGRSAKYPLICEQTKRAAFSRRVTSRIRACNLIPGLMMVPVAKGDGIAWLAIDEIDHKEHHGLVYSLAVKKFQHYVADDIVTHNCLYGWKNGDGHYFINDRSLTTIIEDTADIDKMSKTELKTALKTMLNGGVPTTVIDCEKPSRSEDHPTMKPVKLFAYLMRNSSRERERVLDTFAGSGTTIMAAEQLGRKAYCMELDPHYCDVIIKRWEQFTGRKAERVDR